jgi:hypothetical protein
MPLLANFTIVNVTKYRSRAEVREDSFPPQLNKTWYIMPRSPLNVNRRIGRTYRFFLQGWSVSKAGKHRNTQRYILGDRTLHGHRGETKKSCYLCLFNHRTHQLIVSRDSAVAIATGYGLDEWEVGVRVPVGSRIFTSPRRPDRPWGPPNLLYNGCRGLFPGGKAAGAWSWPLTSNQCRGQGNVDLYIHSPICLHGVVLN